MEGVCTVLGERADWDTAKRVLGDGGFVKRLVEVGFRDVCVFVCVCVCVWIFVRILSARDMSSCNARMRSGESRGSLRLALQVLVGKEAFLLSRVARAHKPF
jgi:hypothetical protein